MENNANEGREQDDHDQAGVSRRGFVVSVVAAGAAATAGRTLPGSRAAQGERAGRAAGTCGSFSVVKGPAVSGELTSASVVSATELWAVGTAGSALHTNKTLIERFNGSTWSVVTSPNQGTSNNGLNGVSMISGGGWAVGYSQPSGTYQPLALQWNGTAWSVNSPAPLTSDSLFVGVDTLADGTAWAVGFQTAANGTRSTLIEHASGGTWTQRRAPTLRPAPTTP